MRVGLKSKKRQVLSRETRDHSLMTVCTISSWRICDLFPLPVAARFSLLSRRPFMYTSFW
jgi:hypothetical protein